MRMSRRMGLYGGNAISKTLESNTWDIISEVSKSGKASSYWSIGDQKIITVNGIQYIADIIGFDHDVPTDTTTYGRSNAGITFQLHDLLSTQYPMFSTNTTTNGWMNSLMRTDTMNVLFNQLNSDLQNVVVPVNKQSGKAGYTTSGVNTTSDNLFLLAEIEIFGSKTISVSGEGSQYAYYSSGNSKIKRVNMAVAEWWLRSHTSGSYYYCYVDGNGEIKNAKPIQNKYVSFAFCV